MRRLSMTLSSVLLLTSAVGCMHKGSDNSAAKSVSAYEDSDQDLGGESNSRPLPKAENCEDIMRSMCTMEYSPQKCTYNGEAIEAGNPCGAKLRARYIACQKNLTYQEADLKCGVESGSQVAKADEAKPVDCNERMMCTREFKPTLCKAEIEGKAVEVRGNNKCESLNNLAQTFCSRKVAFDRTAATCEDAQ